MNLRPDSLANSSLSQEQYLKQVIQQQLDLILKMEEDRKLLKQQNKVFSQQLRSLSLLVDKYKVSNQEIGISTQLPQSYAIPQFQNCPVSAPSGIDLSNQGTQTQPPKSDNTPVLAKLVEAQSFLSQTRPPQQHSEIKQEKDCKFCRSGAKNRAVVTNSQKNVNAEVVKMSKQINSLKRELKEAEHKTKLKEKQIEQQRKCLKNKSQALQKSRKDFNQLSILMNTDKYKSIRTLEQELKSLRGRLESRDDQVTQCRDKQIEQMSHLLSDLTAEYKEYKQETEMKLEILISELANKEKENEELSQDQKKLLKKLELAASGQ